MKLAQKFNRLLMCCVCASLIISFSFFVAPAKAAQTSAEFDFSAEDSIDAYDEYTKQDVQTDDGDTISRVYAGILNELPSSINTLPVDHYRYGAYLRDSEELQRYYFQNLKWNYATSVCYNTLTIYADPEVKFQVTNKSGQPVINTSGVQEQSLVQYYKKSTDNGHIVYFIELTPMEAGQGECMVTFWTDSENVQPHYSFWFGAPLTRKATATLGNFAVSVSAPNRASTAFRLTTSSGIPEKAWVNTVTVKKLSSSGDSLTSRVKLNVTLPGATKGLGALTATSPTLMFDAHPSKVGANDARGTYQVYISDLAWNTVQATGTYRYQGQLSVEYLYAFGA